MTVERIVHNLYYIPGHGQVVVPTGIACHASQGYWRISYKIYPDIPGDERYFRFHWYSDVYHALMDAIGTLEFYAEDMRIGHKVAEEPRRNKMTTLPAGVFVYRYDYCAVVMVADPHSGLRVQKTFPADIDDTTLAQITEEACTKREEYVHNAKLARTYSR
ncbi:hypothetical protein ACLPJK_26710 [Pseudomonas aeruginosa]|uniref:hypothetical protein n=1 Tax=Pseudomonas aeruginosa TaxID=287 RepID=UPI003D29AA20